MNPRAQAAVHLKQVLIEDTLFEPKSIMHKQAGQIKFLCFNILRHYYFLEEILQFLVKKPIKDKEFEVKCIILMGLFELWQQNPKPYAVVNESVEACVALKKAWAKGLVNATLRNFIREQDQLISKVASEQALTNHPKALLKIYQKLWPEQWLSLVQANQSHPPMTLRVNPTTTSRKAYANELSLLGIEHELPQDFEQAICLKQPVPIEKLPHFEQGHVSVQDLSAQKAATLLEANPGMRILDACAAPGGKTAHLFELYPDTKITAIELKQNRCKQLNQTLARLKVKAKVIQADAAQPGTWWDQKHYDRILLDAPCTGTGVIRRHPDIKFKIDENHIAEVVQTQQRLLKALWPTLAPGGILLYVTCSILPQENHQQILKFIESKQDARLVPLEGEQEDLQLLPNQVQDGFYYAKIKKII